jgi:hypothetical protein
MGLLSFWWGTRQLPRRPRTRLRLEPLEDRTLLATRMVVPLAQPIDGVNTFHDLTTAVSAATTLAGDTVQIEPGSVPGGATVSKLLIIQGDPNNGPPSLPAVGALILASSGIQLNNLNVGAVTINNGVTGVLIQRSQVAGITQLTGALANGFNQITFNVITGPVLLGSSAGNPAAASDSVTFNTFTKNTAGTMLRITDDNGSQVQNNSFTDPVNGTTAIEIDDSAPSGVSRNNISLSGAASIGILVDNPFFSTDARLRNNHVSTNFQGTGIATVKAAANTLSVFLSDNDLVSNQVGLRVAGDGTAAATAFGTIDAGGGALGSLGGNDFHTLNGVAGRFSIVATNAVASSATVSAQFNVFTGNPPSTVSAAGGAINLGQAQDANTAFAGIVYDDFFARSGNPTPGSELSFWAGRVNAIGQRKVANMLIRSPEGLTHQIDLLYQVILGRVADAGGESFWASKLLSGTTLEQVAINFLSSAEFMQRANQIATMPAGSDSNFVQSLYILLLGRIGTPGEVAGWVARLPQMGRHGVAKAFVSSLEFRSGVVSTMYAGNTTLPPTSFVSIIPNLLHRPSAPAPSEVAGHAQSKKDIISLEVIFAGSAEFFLNG